MRMKIGALALAILFCLGLAACGNQTITRDFGDFFVSCSKGWDARTTETIEAGSPFLQLLMPEKDHHRSHIDFVMRLYKGLDIENFTEEYALQVMEARGADEGAAMTFENMERMTLGNREGVAIHYWGMISDRKVSFTEQIVPMADRLYQISYVQLNDSDAEEMQRVMESVTFE